jgi:hypothetical protein
VVGRDRVGHVALATVMLALAGALVSGCATPPPASITQTLEQEGADPSSLPAGGVRQDGTMSNGLLPEQWGDTN